MSREAIMDAAAKIVANFGAHDTTAYFLGFAEDASFIFYTHSERLNSRAEYEALWAKWEKENGFHVHSCVSRDQLVQLIGDQVAIFTHLVESKIELDGQLSLVSERETIVFAKVSGSWLAIHEHLSPENLPN